MFLTVRIIDWLQQGSPTLFFVIKTGNGFLISPEDSALLEELISGSAIGHKASLRSINSCLYTWAQDWSLGFGQDGGWLPLENRPGPALPSKAVQGASKPAAKRNILNI